MSKMWARLEMLSPDYMKTEMHVRSCIENWKIRVGLEI